jgi:hypothetical protein
MSYEAGMPSLEERLRAAGRPETPPDGYAHVARTAALGRQPREARVIGLPSRHRVSMFRALLAAAVIAASVAGALLIGVGGDRMPIVHTLSMSGGGGASATIDIGKETGSVRPLVLRVDGLEPAPEGQYYQMWFDTGDATMPIVAFNTSRDGKVEVRGAMPAGLEWVSCWVTIERGPASGAKTVLKAS